MPVTKSAIRHLEGFSVKKPVFVLGITLSRVGFSFLISLLSITALILLQAFVPVRNTGYFPIFLYYSEDALAIMFVLFIFIGGVLFFVWTRKGTFYFFEDHVIWRIGPARASGEYDKMKNVDLDIEAGTMDWQTAPSASVKNRNGISFDYANRRHKFRLGRKNRTKEFEEFLKQHLDLK